MRNPAVAPVLVTVLSFVCSAGALAAGRPLLIISVDGLPPRYVVNADRLGLRIPNLRAFVKDGVSAQGVIGVVPTLTLPSHTTMLTGVTPAEHGIASNVPFDPLMSNYDGLCWYARDIRVPTLWSAARQAGLRSASVNWPVTVGETHIDTLSPEDWGETVESDETRTRFAVELLRTDKPQLLAVHLLALDGTEHHDGPDTAAAYKVLESLDRMIGELAGAAVAAQPDTVVAIVSDHGFVTTHTVVNLRARFVTEGLITLVDSPAASEGLVTSWDVQAWSGGASAAVVLRDPNDAALRRRVGALLGALAAEPANGIANVLDAAGIAASGGFPEAAFIVEFAPGFYFGTGLRGPLLTPAASKGMHGYLPNRTDMHAVFYMKGAGVPLAQDLGVIDMRQLAPTFARVLDVELPSAKQAALLEPAPSHRLAQSQQARERLTAP